MKISNNKFVSLLYDLNVGEGDERELMESVSPEAPVTFVYGMGMMLDSFEKNIFGLAKGDSFSFTISPEEAFGDYEDEKKMELPRSVFEVDGKFDADKVREGEVLTMMDTDGNTHQGIVVEITDSEVLMDFNHPFAGETLHFSGEIVDVHEPTVEELAAITSTGGCGCGGCGSESAEGGCGGCCK